MPQKSVESHFYVSTAKVFSKRQRPLWLLGRSNFLRNKSHIVSRGFPSIKTSSLSFLQLLRCSRHQSHPIRCLVTVPQLKTDSRLRLPLKSTSWMRLCRQKHDVRSPEPRRCQHFHAGSACQMCPLGKSLLSAVLSGNPDDDREKKNVKLAQSKTGKKIMPKCKWLQVGLEIMISFIYSSNLKLAWNAKLWLCSSQTFHPLIVFFALRHL